jgi:hypothetical protein
MRLHSCFLHAEGRHALSCLPYDVLDADLGERRSSGRKLRPTLKAYCVNRSGDFYPYRGEPCKSGYQLGAGNCRKTDGRMVAVPREQCDAMAGTVELPIEGGRLQSPKSMK